METIKGTVEAILGDLKARGAGGAAEDLVKGAFSRKELAHIRIKPCPRGRLDVIVDSSAWLYYFNLKKEALTARIASRLPGIKTVSFVIGEVRAGRKKSGN